MQEAGHFLALLCQLLAGHARTDTLSLGAWLCGWDHGGQGQQIEQGVREEQAVAEVGH